MQVALTQYKLRVLSFDIPREKTISARKQLNFRRAFSSLRRVFGVGFV
jgi:hypothetical protein